MKNRHTRTQVGEEFFRNKKKNSQVRAVTREATPFQVLLAVGIEPGSSSTASERENERESTPVNAESCSVMSVLK